MKYPCPTFLLLSIALVYVGPPDNASASENKHLDWPGYDLKGVACRGEPSNFGPFNYNDSTARKKRLPIVEKFHFYPEIQYLKPGYDLTNNIEYVLRAFPNHPAALNSLVRLSFMPGMKRKIHPPVECYFNRALAMVPKDGTVHLLFAIYLHRLGHLDLAEKQYVIAEDLLPNSAEVAYNYGLLLLDKKQYEGSMLKAKKAYAKHYPLQGLKKRLAKAGYPLD